MLHSWLAAQEFFASFVTLLLPLAHFAWLNKLVSGTSNNSHRQRCEALPDHEATMRHFQMICKKKSSRLAMCFSQQEHSKLLLRKMCSQLSLLIQPVFLVHDRCQAPSDRRQFPCLMRSFFFSKGVASTGVDMRKSASWSNLGEHGQFVLTGQN